MESLRPPRIWLRRLSLTLAALALGGCATLLGRASPPLAKQAIVAVIPVGAGATRLAIAPDGSHVYAAANGTLTLINAASNAVATIIPITPYPAGLTVAPDGRRVYLTNLFSIQLTVVDTTTNTLAAPIQLFAARHRGGFGRIAVTPGGATAYVTNKPNERLAIVNTRHPSALSFVLDMRPTDIALTPDGHTAYVVGCRHTCTSGTIEVLATGTEQVTGYMSVGPKPYRIVLSPDGTRAYTTNLGDATVSVVDLDAKQVTATIPVSVEPVGVALTADGTTLYVTSLEQGTVTVIDTATNHVRGTAKVADAAREIVVTPDGRHAFVLAKNSVVSLDTQALLPHS